MDKKEAAIDIESVIKAYDEKLRRAPSGPAVTDEDVFEEVGKLLSQMTVSRTGGSMGQGELVTISSFCEPSQDKMSVRIAVNSRGHRRVNWEGRPIFLRRGKNSGLLPPRFLDSRGQVVFPNMSRAEYRLSSSSIWVDEMIDMGRDALIPTISDKGGHVTFTVTRGKGVVMVCAATTNPSLKGSAVQFSLLTPGKDQIRLSDTFRLSKKVKDRWTGFREYEESAWTSAPSDKTELVFCVTPKSERSEGQ